MTTPLRLGCQYDGGRSWKAFDAAASYDAVDCVHGTCWASGPAGAVAVLDRW